MADLALPAKGMQVDDLVASQHNRRPVDVRNDGLKKRVQHHVLADRKNVRLLSGAA
jgi:hypothetical protein